MAPSNSSNARRVMAPSGCSSLCSRPVDFPPLRSAATTACAAARSASVAGRNALALGARVHIVVCDVAGAIAAGSMSLIVSNPPYVPLAQRDGLQREVRDFEPHAALFAGPTGFEIYSRIVADAPRVLRPGGWLIMELGFGCEGGVRELLAGWREIEVTPDLAGIPRVIAARAGG